MGNLIQMSEFGKDGQKAGEEPFYFSKTWWTSGGFGHWKVDDEIISHDFPEKLAIHTDDLDKKWGEDEERGKFSHRVGIRRFIEQDLKGDVLLTTKDLSYWYRSKSARVSDYGWQVNHVYWIFHFQFVSDAVAFRMRFDNLISEIKKHKRGEVPEKSSDDTETT